MAMSRKLDDVGMRNGLLPLASAKSMQTNMRDYGLYSIIRGINLVDNLELKRKKNSRQQQEMEGKNFSVYPKEHKSGKKRT